MAQSGWKTLLPIALLVIAGSARAQITTYYLHRENSTVVSSNMQLKTVGPDAASLTLQSVELRNQPAGEYVIKAFETQANVPNIAARSPPPSFLFRMYLNNKTADAGVMQGLVKVYKNNTSGNLICNTTSSSLTTIRVFILFCVQLLQPSRLLHPIDFFCGSESISRPPGSTCKAELSIETMGFARHCYAVDAYTKHRKSFTHNRFDWYAGHGHRN